MDRCDHRRIGLNLKIIRLSKNLKQEYIAHKLGVTSVTYCHWENGQTAISEQKLDEIARFFNLQTATIKGFDLDEQLIVLENNRRE